MQAGRHAGRVLNGFHYHKIGINLMERVLDKGASSGQKKIFPRLLMLLSGSKRASRTINRTLTVAFGIQRWGESCH